MPFWIEAYAKKQTTKQQTNFSKVYIEIYLGISKHFPKFINEHWFKWPSELKYCDWTGRFLFHTPLGVCLSLETLPRSKDLSDLLNKIDKLMWLTLVEWRCPPNNNPMLAEGSQIAY